MVDFAAERARSSGMEDLSAKLEKLLIEAEDFELIGKLAADLHKRELFKRLAVDLRRMARDIEALIARGARTEVTQPQWRPLSASIADTGNGPKYRGH
jgi:hypothetical protein